MIAKPVLVTGWKIPVNSTLDVLTLCADPDGLGYNQVAIGADQNIGLIIQDTFISGYGAGADQ
jgi:hypothetical protein